MINLTIWLVAGSAIGWFASAVMGTTTQRGVILNLLLGVAGSVLAGWLILPLVGAGTINQSDFSFFSLVVAIVGAVAAISARRFASPRAAR